MSSQFFSGAVQLLISAGFATLVVQLLLLRQNRRKIEGEASTSEANAASVLSGAALQQVESARAGETAARTMAQAAIEEQSRLWETNNTLRWDLSAERVYTSLLVRALEAAQIQVPPRVTLEAPPPPAVLPPPSLPPSGFTPAPPTTTETPEPPTA